MDFISGFCAGEFIRNPGSLYTVAGQIVGSFIPFFADARDILPNLQSAIMEDPARWIDVGLNGLGFGMDFLGGADATIVAKAGATVGRFITKNADDIPKALKLLDLVDDNLPKAISDAIKNSDEVADALTKIIKVCESGKNLSVSDFKSLKKACELAGKNIDEIIPTLKFNNFAALKEALGFAGEDKQWHHIVEQCQIKKSNFDIGDINTFSNVKATPNKIHQAISGYYSKNVKNAENFTGLLPSNFNGRVRDWLTNQSFEDQYEFGLKVWEYYMSNPI